jgi:anti-sigma-K factor RskA
MNCQGFPTEDYGMYVLGNLEAPQRDQISEHLATDCAVCESEIRHYTALWPSVALGAPVVTPSRQLRNRLIQSVGGRPSWWSSPLPAMLAVAALAMALAGGWFLGQSKAPALSIAFAPIYRIEIPTPVPSSTPSVRTIVKEVPGPTLEKTIERTIEKTIEKPVDNPAQSAALAALNQDLARERQRATERTQELERQVAQYRVLLDLERKRADQSLLLTGMVSDPALRVVKLRATEKNQFIEGHALIAGNSQMVFYASQLPALPANRVYQLWLIRANGQAIASAGIFTPDSTNRSLLQFKNPSLLTGITTIAVTDEPAGGSTSPTGHKWLIGS